MTTLPTASAMTAVLVTTTTLAAHQADFNNDNVIDAHDLAVLTSNLNQSCEGECPSDLNNDGITDSDDIMILMGLWGQVVEENDDQQNNNNSDDNNAADLSWQEEPPILLDAIYYDQLSRNAQRRNLANLLDQGENAKAWASENGVAVLPYAYNGGVDWYADGVYSDDDKARFKNWVDANIPADYDGPLCLDMEGQWWSVFDTSSQVVMDSVIDFYIEGLEYAQSLRPNAKIGYWGLPKKSHTKENSTTADVSRLLKASTGIFPDVYDNNAVANGSSRLQKRIEKSMEMVEGKVPVYVQASPRYLVNGKYTGLHTVEEFMRDQINSSLNAVWTNSEGKEHRIQGIAMWDAYVYFNWYEENWSTLDNETRKAMFEELDNYHVSMLSAMKTAVDSVAAEFVAQQSAQEQAQQQVADQAASEAKTVAAAAISAKRTSQQSRLTRRLNQAKTSVIARTSNYRKASRSYRSALKSFTAVKKRFRAIKKFGKNSKQYRSAYAAYKKSLKRMRSATRTFKTARSAYRAARVARNNAQSAVNTSASNWEAMANAAAMLSN